jgi:hypothetical protein
VTCEPAGEGWLCEARVGDDAAATTHRVSVSRAELAELAPGSMDPAALVEESFAFLLEREPRESILREFAISDIGRYFPEYRAEMARHPGS